MDCTKSVSPRRSLRSSFCIAGGQNPFHSACPQIYIPPEFPRCTLLQAAALRAVPCLKREHSRIASRRDVPFFRFYAFLCSSDVLQRITSLIIAKVRSCRLRNGYTGYYFVFMLYAFCTLDIGLMHLYNRMECLYAAVFSAPLRHININRR